MRVHEYIDLKIKAYEEDRKLQTNEDDMKIYDTVLGVLYTVKGILLEEDSDNTNLDMIRDLKDTMHDTNILNALIPYMPLDVQEEIKLRRAPNRYKINITRELSDKLRYIDEFGNIYRIYSLKFSEYKQGKQKMILSPMLNKVEVIGNIHESKLQDK